MADERTKREILASSPLFESLMSHEFAMLADLFSVREMDAGDVVFAEGDLGDALFVIAEGTFEVLRHNASGKERLLAELEAPAFFGEMSLIDKAHRSATIRAKTDAKLLQLTNANLHVFAKNHRNGFTWVVVNIARALSKRLRLANQQLSEVP